MKVERRKISVKKKSKREQETLQRRIIGTVYCCFHLSRLPCLSAPHISSETFQTDCGSGSTSQPHAGAVSRWHPHSADLRSRNGQPPLEWMEKPLLSPQRRILFESRLSPSASVLIRTVSLRSAAVMKYSSLLCQLIDSQFSVFFLISLSETASVPFSVSASALSAAQQQIHTYRCSQWFCPVSFKSPAQWVHCLFCKCATSPWKNINFNKFVGWLTSKRTNEFWTE